MTGRNFWPRAAFFIVVILGAAPAATAAPVFYCDAGSREEMAREALIIRTEYLPGLQEIVEGPPGLGDREPAIAQVKEYKARLAELELGLQSCKELREFEASQRRPRPPRKPEADDDLIAPPKPPRPPAEDDDLIAPPRPPPQPPSEDDDLIAPPKPPPAEDDDLLAPPNPPPAQDDDLLAPPRPPPADDNDLLAPPNLHDPLAPPAPSPRP